MRRSTIVPVVFPAVMAGLGTGIATSQGGPVDFRIVHQAVAVDRIAQTADFWVTFNRPPEFLSHANGIGDGFQYEIDSDTTNLDASMGWGEVDSIVRGTEIWEGRGLPVRFRTGDGGGDNAGGWGPERAVLPFELNGATVTFTAPLDVLNAPDGTFRYRAFAVQNGTLSGPVVGAVIPLPMAVWTGLMVLGGFGAVGTIRKARRRS